MATITTKDGAEIFYKDWGPKDAQPVVFHPLPDFFPEGNDNKLMPRNPEPPVMR